MKKLKKILKNKYFIFFIAFTLMFVFLIPNKDLTNGSGDAIETVKIIETFFSKTKYISYVMYKGIYAFIPGVISYNLGKFMSINWFWILKIINSLGFAYISAIGLPYTVEFLINKKLTVFQKYGFIFIYFILEGCYFNFISVDYMSFAIMLLCINSIIKLITNHENYISRIIFTGAILGVCSCLSGQYLPSAIVLTIYCCFIIFKKQKINLMKSQKYLLLILFITSFMGTKMVDKIYQMKVIEPARKAGYWLPNGEEWLLTGFTSNMLTINYPKSVSDNLGKSIILNENLDEKIISQGAAIYNKEGIIKTVLKYPLIFIVRWSERLFLGVMNDNLNLYPSSIIKFKTIYLNIIMGTFIYLSLLVFKENNKKIKDIFSFQTLILIAFLLSALVPSIGHVENRYYMAIRGLFIICAMTKFHFKKNKINLKTKINYNILVYPIFIILILLLYAAIYQSIGPQIDLIYEF